VSLRTDPIEKTVATPDGRELRVRVGVAPDPYIDERERKTVDLEVFEGERPLAALNTVLGVRDDSAAMALVRDVVAGLGEGSLEPTAQALEPLANRTTS
jgi:hypothetical protein